MARKQVFKNNTYVWEDDKISKLSIIENESEENGFALITKEEEEEVNDSPPPKTTSPNYSLMRINDKDEYNNACSSRNCPGTIDSYGYCTKCNRYDHTEGLYGGHY